VGVFVNMAMGVRCFYFVNMAKNVGGFVSMAKKVGVFVNMAKNMVVFVNMVMGVQFLLCQYGKEFGRFCQCSNGYSLFSIWQRISMLIKYRNKHLLLICNVLTNMQFAFSTLMNVQGQ
jgi:hypothetical protein